ncbi:hypothetical protein Cni_G16355 [Canna indica]|uniref:Uncharacterized protein n=1 Tax=Canna indica TaxID=4628 RepID=A0AAQ3QCH9_9LILI|nr:hypothetical protein Cni_G16355 [Canna indica]
MIGRGGERRTKGAAIAPSPSDCCRTMAAAVVDASRGGHRGLAAMSAGAPPAPEAVRGVHQAGESVAGGLDGRPTSSREGGERRRVKQFHIKCQNTFGFEFWSYAMHGVENVPEDNDVER